MAGPGSIAGGASVHSVSSRSSVDMDHQNSGGWGLGGALGRSASSAAGYMRNAVGYGEPSATFKFFDPGLEGQFPEIVPEEEGVEGEVLGRQTVAAQTTGYSLVDNPHDSRRGSQMIEVGLDRDLRDQHQLGGLGRGSLEIERERRGAQIDQAMSQPLPQTLAEMRDLREAITPLDFSRPTPGFTPGGDPTESVAFRNRGLIDLQRERPASELSETPNVSRLDRAVAGAKSFGNNQVVPALKSILKAVDTFCSKVTTPGAVKFGQLYAKATSKMFHGAEKFAAKHPDTAFVLGAGLIAGSIALAAETAGIGLVVFPITMPLAAGLIHGAAKMKSGEDGKYTNLSNNIKNKVSSKISEYVHNTPANPSPLFRIQLNNGGGVPDVYWNDNSRPVSISTSSSSSQSEEPPRG